MKKSIIFIVVLLVNVAVFGQERSYRIQLLEKQLDSLETVIPELKQKVDLNLTDVDLSTILSTIANEKKINFITDPSLKTQRVSYNFANVSVKSLLLHICDKFDLEINSTGNILTVKNFKAQPVPVRQKELSVEYNITEDLFSIDVKNDTLSRVFKKITEVTGKNMLFGVSMGNKKVTSFIKNMPFEGAIDKLAFTNNLEVTKTKDGYYLFQSLDEEISTNAAQNGRRGQGNRTVKRPRRYRNSNIFYKVKDSINKILEVDFENTDVGVIVKDISYALNLDIYTDTNLSNLKKLTFKAKEITFDDLLTKILQDEPGLTYKMENGIYYFTDGQKTATKSFVTIPLMHRSIEIMSTPTGVKRNDYDYNSLFNSSNSSFGSLNNGNSQFSNGVNNGLNSGFNNNNNLNSSRNGFNSNRGRSSASNSNSTPFSNTSSGLQSFAKLIPEDLKKGLDIQVDSELNSFIVGGDAEKIKRFKKFVKQIDKPVPVILIEVMIIEVNKENTVDTGVEFGLGSEPVNDSGKLFPAAENLTLGANTLNKIIGGFNGFGSLNIGKVVPNFYARITAMEKNGNIKIRSTPKLSTLNGHEAVLSNGQRSYYAVIRRDIIGSQNPQTTEIRNYVPIDADLSVSIKPIVAGDDQITMSINVLQSSFVIGSSTAEDAPPGITSREFNSIIRVKNQDIVILGGLEENSKTDTGTGVPFLARIPIIKWFFSRKTRSVSKRKLSVLIKPTIIR
ncbi:hypothetical protein [Tenacibaculum sp. 190524A05c]|uniref:type II secretion system protein GspD n=1 Tax=Tenacibaculum platacis TaxID=3137852 RepID=UPI0031FB5767